jgi:ABC-type branched-subunit amino acid transport system ATPase component
VALLELRAVTAGYGPITVLQDLSLALHAGEIVGVLGANGSGKSTALKTLLGLTQVSAGAVLLDGQDVTAWPGHRRAAAGLGYVPQTQNVFAELTVRENLRMGAYLHPRTWPADAERVYDLFPALAQRREQRAGLLSGGERRMLAIGLTLLQRPRCLLLDEPSSDLAPAMVELVFAAVARIHAELGVPLLLVEQNVTLALRLARRVLVLVRGRCALDVPTAALDLAHLHRVFLEGSDTP